MIVFTIKDANLCEETAHIHDFSKQSSNTTERGQTDNIKSQQIVSTNESTIVSTLYDQSQTVLHTSYKFVCEHFQNTLFK